MSYIQTPGPLPGEQWIPSNGTVGFSFLEGTCSQCARDKSWRTGCDIDECAPDEICEIIAASFRDEAVEWRRMPDGEIKCIAFLPAPPDSAVVRDDRTADMFGEES